MVDRPRFPFRATSEWDNGRLGLP
eukprot:COSAG04_NODE_29473_length_268_cov_1.390533_1_plen_23_part_10